MTEEQATAGLRDHQVVDFDAHFWNPSTEL